MNEQSCNPVVCNSDSAFNQLDDQSLNSLVGDFLKGVIPEGYLSIEDQDQPVKICRGLQMQRLSRLVNESQIVFVYRLQNTSNNCKTVTECQVNVLDGDWVFLDRYTLKPEEFSIVLIGCMR
jgi:hypothetical protein